MGVSAIRAPTKDLDNHQVVLTQLKEATETAQRIRGNANDSYVKLGELISAGIVRFTDNIVSPGALPTTGGGLTSVAVSDSITGNGTVGTPLLLVGDSATPGNTMLYGTNGAGTKGWYAQPTGGGGSNPFNVTPDTHGTGVPSFVANDEFEGAALDTAGTRFAGAIPWSWLQQNTATITLGQGAAQFIGQLVATNTINAIIQTVAVGTAWRYRSKAMCFVPSTNNYCAPLFLRESTSDKVMSIGIFNNAGTLQLLVAGGTLATGFTLVPFSATATQWLIGFPGLVTVPGAPVYFEIERAGVNMIYRISNSGYDNSFSQIYTDTVTTDFTTAPDQIGMCVRSDNVSAGIEMWIDWFRRMA